MRSPEAVFRAIVDQGAVPLMVGLITGAITVTGLVIGAVMWARAVRAERKERRSRA